MSKMHSLQLQVTLLMWTGGSERWLCRSEGSCFPRNLASRPSLHPLYFPFHSPLLLTSSPSAHCSSQRLAVAALPTSRLLVTASCATSPRLPLERRNIGKCRTLLFSWQGQQGFTPPARFLLCLMLCLW